MKKILLNADLGEGEPLARTRALMKLIDLANIACGGHAGNARSMLATVNLAIEHGVAVGAHPGFADGFGRASAEINGEALEILLLQQVGALSRVAASVGIGLHHVKLHGALYHAVETSDRLAREYVRCVGDWFPGLTIVGFSGGRVQAIGEKLNVPVLAEAFAERGYGGDGKLIPRGQPGDLITSPAEVAGRVRLLRDAGRMPVENEDNIPLGADTLCVHADSPNSVEIARAARRALDA